VHQSDRVASRRDGRRGCVQEVSVTERDIVTSVILAQHHRERETGVTEAEGLLGHRAGGIQICRSEGR